MRTARTVVRAIVTAATLLTAGCGANSQSMPLAPPPPPGGLATANVYILPGGVDLGPTAFGDEAIVIFKGERMRFRNLDSIEHTVVADTTSLPEFATTGALAPGAEQTFTMNTLGTTTLHCVDHPQMTGTLIVREK
jgi:plastocyanin